MVKTEVTKQWVESAEEQRIEYEIDMAARDGSGDNEHVTITVAGFKDPYAAVAAAIKFTDGLTKMALNGGMIPDDDDGPLSIGDVDQVEAEIRQLLGEEMDED